MKCVKLLVLLIIGTVGCNKIENYSNNVPVDAISQTGSGQYLNSSKQDGTLVNTSTEIEIVNEVYPEIFPFSASLQTLNKLSGNFEIEIPISYRATPETNFIFNCRLEKVQNNNKDISIIIASQSADTSKGQIGVSTNGGSFNNMLYSTSTAVDSLFKWNNTVLVQKDTSEYAIYLNRKGTQLNVRIVGNKFNQIGNGKELFNANYSVHDSGFISMQWLSQPLVNGTRERAFFDNFNFLLNFKWIDEKTYYKQFRL